MIYAFHLPLTNYGFWLPNDSRGSGSDYVRNKKLLPYGEATKVKTRRSVAWRPQNFEVKRLARSALRYPPVEFTGLQALSCGRGIKRAIEKYGFVIWACCIQPDHMHLVVKRHRYPIEQVIRQLRTEMTQQLLEDGLHPLVAMRDREPDGSIPSIWGRSPWKVFLDDEEGILRSIDYVRDNPLRRKLRRQKWSFVVPYRGLRAEFGRA
jgi:REP element-mobilizing transposase RayT